MKEKCPKCGTDVIFDDLGINMVKKCEYRRFVCRLNPLNIGAYFLVQGGAKFCDYERTECGQFTEGRE